MQTDIQSALDSAVATHKANLIDKMRSIEPMRSPLGDDLLLYAVGSALTGDYYQLQNGEAARFVSTAERLGLVTIRQLSDACAKLEVTEEGLIYWQSRGGDISGHIPNCPPIDQLAYQEPEAPATSGL
jgi:hypothetical protein